MNIYRNNLLRIIFILIALFSFTACGGGGGSSDPVPDPPQSGSSNWDEMKWNQDNWS